MTDSVASSIALFFYLTLMDEARAKTCASEAVSLYNSSFTSKTDWSEAAEVVRSTHAVMNKISSRFVRGRPNLSTHAGWNLPAGFDLGPWREFQKNAALDELLVVTWSSVLGISNEDIAKGWGVTSGTVKYRMALGLRKLGAMVPQVRHGSNVYLGVVK